jgi:hypothetical protein
MDVGSRAIWAESTSASPHHGLRIGKPAGARSLTLRPHPLGGRSPARKLVATAPEAESGRVDIASGNFNRALGHREPNIRSRNGRPPVAEAAA